MKPMHILLADDQPIVRVGFMSLLRTLADKVIFHEAADERAVIAIATEHQPRVAVIDLSLAGAMTLELIKNLKHSVPAMPILVASVQDEMHYAERALRAGARGYVMKHRTAQSILQAVEAVSKGNVWLSENFRNQLVERMVDGPRADKSLGLESLSDRELSVFRLIGIGLKKSEIAKKLNLSPNTVETYRSHIKQKLNVANGGELSRLAFLQLQEERHPL
jgi:DNA-binding NarL/FixJ family response regulator